jgi:hypothetical protein
MEELKKLLSTLKADSPVETIKTTFSKIADILLSKSYIKTEHGNYRLLEIEFYFKNKYHEDNVTLKRYEDDKEGGMWWLHEWGVDLSFKCDLSSKNKCDNFYGGILIRSIMSLKNDGQCEKEFFFGPRNCCWELFYSSALEQNTAPRIVVDDKIQLSGKMATTKRYITGKTKKVDGDYRFYVEGLNFTVEPNYKNASPWK